jgi:hypothetical protein
MSRELILGLMEQGQIFDADKMRFWLKRERSVEPVPTVEARSIAAALIGLSLGSEH